MDILECAVIIVPGVLAALQFLKTSPSTAIYQQRSDNRKHYTTASLLILLLICSSVVINLVFAIIKNNEETEKEKRTTQLQANLEYRTYQLDSLRNTIEKMSVLTDSLHENRKILLEELRKYTSTPLTFTYNSGVPVFQLCKEERISFEQNQRNSNAYTFKANFCVDRDIHDLFITPYFVTSTNGTTDVIVRQPNDPYYQQAMTKGNMFSPQGILNLKEGVDTLFVVFEGSFINNEDRKFPVDMIYYRTTGTNLWWGAPPAMHQRIRSLVKNAIRR